MKLQFLTLLLLYTLSLFAQKDPINLLEYNPQYGTKQHFLEESPGKDRVIIPQLRGVLLMSREIYPSNVELEQAIGSVDTINLQIPGNITKLYSLISNAFLNQPLTQQDILNLKHAIIMHYRRWGRPVVTLEIPKQNITNGVLQIIVIEGKLGKISVEENKHFKKEMLRSYIRLQEGKPIDSHTLLTDINWINRNPFRRVDVIYTPGSEEGDTDIRLLTSDRRPWKGFISIDNSGYDDTNTIRLCVGTSWGNLFNLDHLLSLQCSCAPHMHRLWSLSGHYTIPLPWRDVCSIYGGYSSVHPNLKQKNVHSSGYCAQASLRYNFIISPLSTLLQDLFVGCDYKRMNNNIEFGEKRIYQKSITIAHIVLGYNGAHDSSWIKSSLILELFYSPPGPWLPRHSKKDYHLVRPKAKIHYLYSRFTFAPIVQLPKDFSLLLTLRGQIASCPLMTSEQFGLGGHNTIRGYKEREVNVDNALLASAELRTKPLPLIKTNQVKDGLQLLVFLDYGIGNNIYTDPKINPKEKKSVYLLSIGPGIRYEITPHVNFRGDLGFQLHKLSKHHHNQCFHFSLVGTY